MKLDQHTPKLNQNSEFSELSDRSNKISKTKSRSSVLLSKITSIKVEVKISVALCLFGIAAIVKALS